MQPKSIASYTPWASDGTSPSGSHSGIPTGSETAPDGLAPSDAHGSKLEIRFCRTIRQEAFKTPTGLPRPVNQVPKLLNPPPTTLRLDLLSHGKKPPFVTPFPFFWPFRVACRGR